MKKRNTKAGPEQNSNWLPGLSLAIAFCCLPMPVAADVTIDDRAVGRVVDAAVSYFYQKNINRKTVESACYFDPEVEGSMRCSWSAGGGGADAYSMQQRVKRRVLKGCRKRGGKKCVLFFRNGTIRFDELSPEQSEKAELALAGIPTHQREGTALPEGTALTSDFRDWFSEARDYWEGIRTKNPGRNPHYSICANEQGSYASFYMQGRGTAISNVRNMCILKCRVFSELNSKEGECFAIYEDGAFVSAAAENAVMQ